MGGVYLRRMPMTKLCLINTRSYYARSPASISNFVDSLRHFLCLICGRMTTQNIGFVALVQIASCYCITRVWINF